MCRLRQHLGSRQLSASVLTSRPTHPPRDCAQRCKWQRHSTIVAAWLVFVVLWQAASAAEDVKSWILQNEDTQLRIGLVENREAVLQLAAVGADDNWVSRPAVVSLMETIWHDGAEMKLDWQYQQGTWDAPSGRLTLSYRNAVPQVQLRSQWQVRPGHGPVEHWFEFENLSGATIAVSQQDSLTLEGLASSGPASLWWIRRGGSNASTQGGTYEQPLAAGLDLVLASDCSDGASPVPWMAVQVGNEHGLYVGWEFSGLGRVHAQAKQGESLQLSLHVGLHDDFRTDVQPGEVFTVPTAFVGCYRGELDEGSYCLHQFILAHLRPTLPPETPDPILAYNLYLDVGGNRATEADVLRSAATCRELGFEAFMPDAMWFPETGDWRWDPRRFPQGVRPIEEYVHKAGMQFALWCAWTNGGVSNDSAALSVRGEVGRPDWFSSDFASDWQPGPFYGGMLCLASPEAARWAQEKTQWLVRHHRLDYLKHDINPIVTQCNKTAHRHQYGVDTSYWSTRAYYRIQQRLRQEFPGLILENCSGGGHIKDFGVIAQTHYTVATDTLSNLPNRQAIYDSTYAFPPKVLQCYTYDNYYPVRGDQPGTFLWRSAMMGAWQIDPTDTITWTQEEKASVVRSVEIYRQWIRPMLSDVKVHHILPRPDGMCWDGMFYWSPSLRRGTLYVWRPESPETRQPIRLKGLDRQGKYWVWSEDGSLAAGVRSGEELMDAGLELELPSVYSSDLVYVQDQSLDKPDGLTVPGPFRLQPAVATAGVFSVQARLAWEPAEGARSYRVRVATDAQFREELACRVVLYPEATIDELPAGKAIYWRVEAIGWGGRRWQEGPSGEFVSPQLNRPEGLLFLSDLQWTVATAGADNDVRRDQNYYRKPLSIGRHAYVKGLWTHAYPDETPSDIVYDVTGHPAALFKADVGLDDASGGGSVVFQVLVDGAEKAESPVMRPHAVHTMCVDISDARQITLRVTNAADGYTCDHAVWAHARLVAPGLKDPLD